VRDAVYQFLSLSALDRPPHVSKKPQTWDAKLVSLTAIA
jgi:hypothetical protein